MFPTTSNRDYVIYVEILKRHGALANLTDAFVSVIQNLPIHPLNKRFADASPALLITNAFATSRATSIFLG